jgi:AcrR family transcriptional regulator
MAEPSPTPTRMAAPDRRAQLLDVTKAIVAEQGFHAVSIEAVARAAGISRPIVYGHFGDLAGLLEALVERESARALSQLVVVRPDDLASGDPREVLLAALEGYLRAVQADPATWRLVLMPPEGAPALLREHIADGHAAVIAQLAAALSAGAGAGAPLRSPDPELTARALSAIADEAARLLLGAPERYGVERVLAHARWMLEQFSPAV